MADCIFCAILAGKLPSSRPYEDDQVIALMDTRPVNPGHLLVIPKRHAAHLADLPPEVGAQMFRVGQRMAGALYSSGLRCEGINLYLADGERAGQEVFHVHLHVLPRYKGDGFGLKLGPEYGFTPPRAVLDEAASMIRGALDLAAP